MKQAKQYFDNHEAASLLYFTSDGLAFFDGANAQNHAANLDDKTITPLTRDEAEQAANAALHEYDPLDEPDAE